MPSGEPRARHYRRHRKSPAPPKSERVAIPQPRALSEVERKEIRRVLNSTEHADEAPATVYAKLLDEGVYLGSVATMYRVLREHGEVGDRRRHATHPARVKPELVATAPNQVYSWDITKLLGPAKWTYYYLYSIIDIYSRYVPGWMLARAQRASLAEALMAETIEKQGIRSGEGSRATSSRRQCRQRQGSTSGLVEPFGVRRPGGLGLGPGRVGFPLRPLGRGRSCRWWGRAQYVELRPSLGGIGPGGVRSEACSYRTTRRSEESESQKGRDA